MKLMYLGEVRRNGSYPQVKVGDEYLNVVDGFVDVDKAEAKALVASGNFAEVDGDSSEGDEDFRNELLEQAKALGLKPHHKSGVETLQKMISEAEAKAE